MQHEPTDLLLLEEVSALTRVPVETLKYWRKLKNGRGPKLFRVGGRVVAFRRDVSAWVLEQMRKEHAVASGSELVAQRAGGDA